MLRAASRDSGCHTRAVPDTGAPHHTRFCRPCTLSSDTPQTLANVFPGKTFKGTSYLLNDRWWRIDPMHFMGDREPFAAYYTILFIAGGISRST